MSSTRPNKLILYFTAYLIHYFYCSTTTCDRQKQIVDLESTSKNTSKNNKNIIHAINETKPNYQKLLNKNLLD